MIWPVIVIGVVALLLLGLTIYAIHRAESRDPIDEGGMTPEDYE